MLTLWDMLKPAVAPVAKSARDLLLGKPAAAKPRVETRTPSTTQPSLRSKRRAEVFAKPRRNDGDAGMQAKYDALVREMLTTYGVRVRKWRTNSSGVAWTITYKDGHVVRLLESPQPRGPMSMAIFLHEIGHHAIGLGVYKPRCLEEYHAWAFAIRTMEERGLNVTDRVRERMYKSLRYAVRKARRRGLKELPVELLPYAA